jgi:hypothetical protein
MRRPTYRCITAEVIGFAVMIGLPRSERVIPVSDSGSGSLDPDELRQLVVAVGSATAAAGDGVDIVEGSLRRIFEATSIVDN